MYKRYFALATAAALALSLTACGGFIPGGAKCAQLFRFRGGFRQ